MSTRSGADAARAAGARPAGRLPAGRAASLPPSDEAPPGAAHRGAVMRRLLIIVPPLYFDPSQTLVQEKYRLLSRLYSGSVLYMAHLRALRYRSCGSFELHSLYLPRLLRASSLSQNLCYAVFVLVKSLCLRARKRKFDIVIAHDPFNTGLLAFVVSRLIGARLVVDVLGNHAKSLRVASKTAGVVDRVKHYLAMRLTPLVLNRADGVKLVYTEQLEPFEPLLRIARRATFPDFTPISRFGWREGRSRYILFTGGPWFLKGVDVLIKAFQQISDAFPHYTLKIVGYTPERAYFERLAAGHPRIELHWPVPYERVVELMGECSLFVLPSRTEAMARVLLEAMASRKPVVASRVDGIPTYIRDGYNGLLVEPGDVDDLAEKMRRILADEALSRQLADNGYHYVRTHLSEEAYLAKFSAMVEDVLSR